MVKTRLLLTTPHFTVLYIFIAIYNLNMSSFKIFCAEHTFGPNGFQFWKNQTWGVWTDSNNKC